MGEAARALEPVIQAKYRPFEDGIRRWRDLDFGDWLGLERPRNIRTNQIERNRAELEAHGPLLQIEANPSEQGGRPGIEYWLNFDQCMVICALSRTPRAEEVRTAMIRVFGKFVRGEVATMPRMDIRAMEVAVDRIVGPICDRIVAPILAEQREFHQHVLGKLDRHEARFLTVEHELVSVKRSLNTRRHEFSAKTRAGYIATVEHHCNCKCPSCREVDVVRNGELLPAGRVEHWRGANRNRPEDGWITCSTCNDRFENDESYRDSKYGAFIAFHDARRAELKALSSQGMLDLK